MTGAWPGLSGKTVLVTGATGFIGGRLVERLARECNANVRVLVRNVTRLPRIARFPIDIVRGDVTDAECVMAAVAGCDVVFHCVYAMGRDVEATQNILEAARAHGIGRVVHLSSLMAYGETPDGDIDETHPRQALPDIYSESKLASERLACEYRDDYGLPVVILQPTGIYGPFSDGYGAKILETMKRRRLILLNDGDGLFNCIYIDDAVEAMLLSAVKEEAVGEAFLISSETVTWREFYSRFERMLGLTSTVSMTVHEAREYLHTFSREKRDRERMKRFKRVARAVLPDAIVRTIKDKNPAHRNEPSRQRGEPNTELRPIQPIHEWAIPFYASKTNVRIDKARQLLGFTPRTSFSEGIDLTEQWAQWAGLVKSAHTD